MKYIYKAIIFTGLTLSIACNNFLDVETRGVVTEDAQFKDIEGFKSAMRGVYASMASTELYGGQLTYDFTDKIGQVFLGESTKNNANIEIAKFNYLNAEVRPIIDKIWAEMYKTISYVNNIIAHQETTSLQGLEMQTMKGEAYGLRAFLHFDLVRLFSEDYIVNPSAKGIPYSYTFDLDNKKVYSLKESLENILKDLDIAESLLSNDNYNKIDSDLEAYPSYSGNYFRFFNKYAVKALKARVYYIMGDMQKAQKYASEVIDSELLQLGTVQGFPAKSEFIFSANINSKVVSQAIYNMFIDIQGRDNFSLGRTPEALQNLYESSNFSTDNTDIRLSQYYEFKASKSKFIRYIRTESDVTNHSLTDIPLIRLPEMYFILAEAQYKTNPTEAIKTLEKVRKSRGLGKALDPLKINTEDKFIDEMLKARVREMPGEGQIFYALKHYNKKFKSILKNDSGSYIEVEPSTEIFVLPVPNDEKEFGNY